MGLGKKPANPASLNFPERLMVEEEKAKRGRSDMGRNKKREYYCSVVQ